MIEVSDEMDSGQKSSFELEFTGNWFIDAGILGFVNLMEELYGWDLDELQRKIREEPEAVFYWYFPIGYICHVVREVTSKESEESRKKVEETIKKIPTAPTVKDKALLFEEAWKWLISNESLIGETKRGKKRIKMSWSGRYRILTNFPLFQPSYDFEGQKNIFMSLLGLKEIKDKVLMYIDKSTSKFLPSASDFPNIPYTKSCITIDVLLSLTPKAPIFILTYPNAFISDSVVLTSLGYWIMFYSPELRLAYIVNKRLRKYIEKHKQENLDIFKITWRSIVDSMSETESMWSLENMYLIKIKPPVGRKQDLESVEYIGIPKLQASIIIDDTLRDALNKNIPIKTSKSKIEKEVWILEELIRDRPLLPHLIHHVNIFLADRTNKIYYAGKRSLIYSSIVDAKIREFGEDNRLFNENFFKRYREILTEIKDTAKWALRISNIFRDLFEDQDERKSYANLLLTIIKRNDKYRFVNALLKTITDKNVNRDIKNLVNFSFSKILSNDLSWKNYAFVFVVGLVDRGEENGGS